MSLRCIGFDTRVCRSNVRAHAHRITHHWNENRPSRPVLQRCDCGGPEHPRALKPKGCTQPKSASKCACGRWSVVVPRAASCTLPSFPGTLLESGSGPVLVRVVKGLVSLSATTCAEQLDACCVVGTALAVYIALASIAKQTQMPAQRSALA